MASNTDKGGEHEMAVERVPKVSAKDLPVANKILGYLADHPGIKLVAIEQHVGVSRIEVGRVIYQLMLQGLVSRNEETREYYPTQWEPRG